MDQTLRVFLVLVLLGSVFTSDIFDLPCSSNPDCSTVTGAVCNEAIGSCYCPGYYVINNYMTECLPVLPGPGSTCETDAQCSASMLVGGACIDGKCGCIESMHYHLGRCWNTKVLGEECSVSEECRGLLAPEAVECKEGVCSCTENFYQREYSDCRPMTNEIGGPCALDFDCHFNGSFCENKKCACLPGATSCQSQPTDKKHEKSEYKISLESPEITKVAKAWGSVCSSPVDCGLSNSECTVSGYCACQNGYFLLPDNPDSCVPEIGGPCSSSEDCTVGNSTCVDNVCSCLIGFSAAANRTTCLTQVMDYKRRCTERSECMLFGGRGTCIAQGSTLVCDCEPGSRHIVDEHICWISKGPGKTCSDQRDCYITDKNQNVLCDEEEGVCKCWDGYHASLDGTNCHLNAPELGNKCTENTDCEVTNSQCTSSKCVCKTGYFQQDGKCITGVGGSCTDSSACSGIPNSECVSSKCACAAGFVSSIDITTCLPVGDGIGATCEEAQQCTGALGVNAACTESVCACAKKHHLNPLDSQCIPSKRLGESCSRSVDCFLPDGNEGVVCRNYVCVCDFGYQPEEDKSQCRSSGAVINFSLIVVLVTSLINTWL